MGKHPEVPDDGAEPRRSDLALQAQALRADWPMAPGVRTRVLGVAARLALGSKKERVRLAAIKVLMNADVLNLRQQALDLARERFAAESAPPEASVTLAELVADAEDAARALDHDRTTADHAPPRAVP